ncbi:hypothetical protein GCM10009612_35050 [Streptomyces beijiangensis]
MAVAAGCAALLAVLSVVVVVRNGAPLPGDLGAHSWGLDHRPPVGLAFGRAVTATGTGVLPYVIALAAGLLAVLPRDAAPLPALRGPAFLRGVRGAWICAVAAPLAFLALGQALRFGLMEAVGRARPPAADWVTHASGFAFPSGHATTSALAAGLLGWAVLVRVRRAALHRTVCVLLACWAVAVGLSRVYLGVHWASDVLAGWLFAACLIAVGVALAPLLRTSIRLPEAAATSSR